MGGQACCLQPQVSIKLEPLFVCLFVTTFLLGPTISIYYIAEKEATCEGAQ